MDEKIELTLTSRLSDTTSIASSVRTLETMDSKTSLFGNDSSIQFSRDTVDPNSSKNCKRTMLTLVQILVTTLTIVAIVLSITAITYYFSVMQRQGDDIKNLKTQIVMLEQMINTSRENQREMEDISSSIETVNNKIETVKNSVNTLNETLNRDLDNRENKISEEFMDTLQHFEDSIQQLSAKIGGNLGRITSINDSILILDGKIQQANENNVNTTVNLYDNCTVDREMCSGAELSNLYWRVCATPFLPINKTGYFTVDMQCDYESNYTGHMATSVLKKNSEEGTVQCKCNILSPDHYRDNFFEIRHDFTFVCSIIITRCPLSFFV